MKIFDVSEVGKVYGIYDKQPVAGKSVHRAAAVPKADKLLLSRDAMDFQAVMKGLKNAPDVRADKVAEFGAKYEAGDYQADTRDVAESLFKSGLFAKTIPNA
ncbi:MAG: flagellar biosynthesis anti-sigma factor FlgM [Clostridiales bacterium]|jgi:anti-sigma28 factor (negative regulator of flagellin synthesis)|nr:flagellar biosynthesis anti-sigma factor FlgM [Clostridiales bacterium]